ncbi:hypothetical protein ACLKA7_013934 [Drosophila subpalustris]
MSTYLLQYMQTETEKRETGIAHWDKQKLKTMSSDNFAVNGHLEGTADIGHNGLVLDTGRDWYLIYKYISGNRTKPSAGEATRGESGVASAEAAARAMGSNS